MSLAHIADQLRRQQFDPEAPASVDTAYQVSRARRESAAAELARLELRRRASELMDAAAVSECLAAANAVVREELGKLGAEIVEAIRPVAGDEAGIKLEMDRCICAALHRLCDRLELEL